MLLPSPWIDHGAGIPSAIATESRGGSVPASSRATLEYTAARDVAAVAVFAVGVMTCKCQSKKREKRAPRCGGIRTSAVHTQLPA